MFKWFERWAKPQPTTEVELTPGEPRCVNLHHKTQECRVEGSVSYTAPVSCSACYIVNLQKQFDEIKNKKPKTENQLLTRILELEQEVSYLKQLNPSGMNTNRGFSGVKYYR